MKKSGILDNYYKLLLLFFVIAFVVFYPALNGNLLFDDPRIMFFLKKAQSPFYYLTHISELKAIGIPNRYSYGYWLFLTFQYMLWGDNAFAFKFVNMLFHVFTAFTGFLFVKELIASRLDKKIAPYFAFFVSLLFLVSPVTTEAVNLLLGTSNGVGGFFFLSGGYFFVLFLKKREGIQRYYLLFSSLVFFVIASLFKEVYLIFPLFCAVLNLYLTKPSFKKIGVAGIVFVFFVGFLIYGAMNFKTSPFQRLKYAFRNSNRVKTAVATNTYVHFYGIRLFLFPDDLNIDHDIKKINSFSDGRFVFSLFFLLIFSFLLYRYRDKLPLSFFSLVCYFVLMAPSNSFLIRGGIFGRYDWLSERNMYLPVFFLSIVLADILRFVLKNDLKKFKTLMTIIIILFAARGFARNLDYKDNYVFWLSSVKYSPDKARPNYNLAVELRKMGRIDEALKYARKAYKIKPSESTAGLLANIYKDLGKEDIFVDFVKSNLRKRGVRKTSLFHLLGEYYYQKGEFKRAEKLLLKAASSDKSYLLPRLSLLYLYIYNEDWNSAQAIADYIENKKLIEKGKTRREFVDPAMVSRYYFAKALILVHKNEDKKALDLTLKAIRLNPDFTEPYLKLGEYYFNKKDFAKSKQYFLKAKKTKDYRKYQKVAENYLKAIEENNGNN